LRLLKVPCSIEENLQRAAQTVAAQLHVNGYAYNDDVATLKVWIQMYLEKYGHGRGVKTTDLEINPEVTDESYEESTDWTRWALDNCS
tara:strand:+ start:985 stop:1248 length:264 start_codon:yes stop_codon:yes gene_type:complete